LTGAFHVPGSTFQVPRSRFHVPGSTFQVGDRVRWTLNEETEGTIQEGFFSAGAEGSPKVNYQVRKDVGLFFTTQQECLVTLEENLDEEG
jgi:hypothetical protein